jgi:hypothetical protein
VKLKWLDQWILRSTGLTRTRTAYSGIVWDCTAFHHLLLALKPRPQGLHILVAVTAPCFDDIRTITRLQSVLDGIMALVNTVRTLRYAWGNTHTPQGIHSHQSHTLGVMMSSRSQRTISKIYRSYSKYLKINGCGAQQDCHQARKLIEYVMDDSKDGLPGNLLDTSTLYNPWTLISPTRILNRQNLKFLLHIVKAWYTDFYN